MDIVVDFSHIVLVGDEGQQKGRLEDPAGEFDLLGIWEVVDLPRSAFWEKPNGTENSS